MSIDFYCMGIIYLYIGLMFLLLGVGVVGIWFRIRKKPFKYWWLIPYSLLYVIFAQCLTGTAYIAYDDVADPNYMNYKGWVLEDFILNDIKRLIIWLGIGAVLFLIIKKGPGNLKLIIQCVICTLATLAVSATLLMMIGAMMA